MNIKDFKVGQTVFKKQNCCENAVSKYSNYLKYYFGMSNTFSIGNVNYIDSNFIILDKVLYKIVVE